MRQISVVSIDIYSYGKAMSACVNWIINDEEKTNRIAPLNEFSSQLCISIK